METLVPGRLICSTFWMAALLLWLGTGALGIITPNHLQTIIQYITNYGVETQYSFAVSLPTSVCSDPSHLAEVLPKQVLKNMKNTLNQPNGLYNPGNVNIVASRPWFNDMTTEKHHSEWRLLQGGQNSPVRKLLGRTPNEKRCLIFFTLKSPCLRTCLRKNGNFSILPMVKATFSLANDSYRAFVFQQIFQDDQGKGQQLLDAWSELGGAVPLMRCDNNGCQQYTGDGMSNRRNG